MQKVATQRKQAAKHEYVNVNFLCPDQYGSQPTQSYTLPEGHCNESDNNPGRSERDRAQDEPHITRGH